MSTVNPGLNPTVVTDPIPATPVIDSVLPSEGVVDAAMGVANRWDDR